MFEGSAQHCGCCNFSLPRLDSATIWLGCKYLQEEGQGEGTASVDLGVHLPSKGQGCARKGRQSRNAQAMFQQLSKRSLADRSTRLDRLGNDESSRVRAGTQLLCRRRRLEVGSRWSGCVVMILLLKNCSWGLPQPTAFLMSGNGVCFCPGTDRYGLNGSSFV